MAVFLGIDYGSAMLKAARVAGDGAKPGLIRLSPVGFFLPAAVEFSASGQAYVVGDAPFQGRRRADRAVAFAFRDRIQQPAARFVLPSATLAGDDLHTAVLRSLATALAQDRTAPCVVAVPDSWQSTAWALAPALERAGLLPSFLVRESLAVVAMLESPPAPALLLLSLGVSAASATLVVTRDGISSPVATRQSAAISGLALRKLLEDHFAEQIIQVSRRDPRDDSTADQALADAVEALCRSLANDVSAVFRGEFWGQVHETPFSLTQLAALAEAKFRGPLTRLVDDALAAAPERQPVCPLVAWGDLSLLLPLNNWFADRLPPKTPLAILPLDTVAAGAARLCARFAAQQASSPWPSESFTTIRASDGQLLHRPPAAAPGAEHWLLQRLPRDFARADQAPSALLRLLNGSQPATRTLAAGPFVIGRGPRCHWIFNYADFPMVSAEHARIEGKGDRFLVSDLGSSNGTFVNDVAVEKPQPLRSGDLIRLGTNGPRLKFEQLS